ncbi:methionine aminopeptidase [Clostridia bacterium]|nr:methionine aminopeptidase [Clostridia bacterium]
MRVCGDRDKTLIYIKTAEQLGKMREACEISSAVLIDAAAAVVSEATTFEIERVVARAFKGYGAKPSFLGMYGFPHSACISVNEELIHGLASKTRVLRDGDIVTVDAGAFYNGYHGDNAYTYVVGGAEKASPDTLRLLRTTEEALYLGISAAVAGNRVGDIGNAVQAHAEGAGYHVVEKFVGHGIGRELHEDPEIPNFGTKGRGRRLSVGMTIAIEPMINTTTKDVEILPDGWTVVEQKRALCAHFEHTVAVTENGAVRLTNWDKGLAGYRNVG